MSLKLSFAAIMSAFILAACGQGEPASEAPAYIPESVRQARALEAEQAAKIEAATSGRAWSIVDVSGQAMIEGSGASLAFGQDQSVSGSTGCNSLNGAFTLDGAQLTFGPLATTRKMCPGPLMEQERFVLDTLGQVISAGVNEDGLLFLSTLNGDVIKLAQRDE